MGMLVKKILLLTILSFLLTASTPALDVSLKLSGGMSLMELGNINRVLQEWVRYYKTESDQKDSVTYLEGEVLNLKTAVDLEGEIVFTVTPRLTLGLGSGLIHAALSQEKTTILVDRPAGTTRYSHPVQISVIPATLSASYSFKISKTLKAYVKAGGGLAWMKWIERSGRKNITKNQNVQWLTYHDAVSHAPIIMGGLGLLYQIEPGIDLLIEGAVRQTKFKDIAGVNIDDENGTLYHLEQYSEEFDFWLEKFEIDSEAPSGDMYRSIRKAVIDFSGASFKIGLLIRF